MTKKWYVLTVAACCGLTISTLGLVFNCIGVFYTPMSESLGTGRGAVAFFGTLALLANGLSNPLFPKLVKRFGLTGVIAIGSIICGAATALVSVTTALWQIYVLGFIQGFSVALFSSVAVTTILGNWFREKLGFVTGIAFCFSGVTGAIFSPVFNNVILSLGWRTSFVILGVLITLFSLPGALCLLKLDPKERGLSPYGLETTASTAVQKTEAAAAKPVPVYLFVLLCMLAVFPSFCTGMTQHFSGFAESVGLSSAIGAAMISATMIGNLSSKLIIGMISDKIGPLRAFAVMLCTCLAALALLILSPVYNMTLCCVCGLLFGSAYSVASVGIPLVTRVVYGSERYSQVYPRIAMIASLGSASAMTVVGFIYDFTRSYRAAFICGIVFILICLSILAVISRRK